MNFLSLLIIVFATCADVGFAIHNILTDEEFSKVFRTTRDNVPEYEVVPIMHNLHNRSSGKLRVQFSGFDQFFDIHLDPSDGILAGEKTPVWLASPTSNGTVDYKRMSPNIMGIVASSFQSPDSVAALLVAGFRNNKPRFEGTVDDITVREWPVRVQEVTKKHFDRLKRKVPNSSTTLIPTDFHVIIKRKTSATERIALKAQADGIVRSFNESNNHAIKRSPNEVIYPSILIVTDYSGTQKIHDESKFHNDIRYQLAFWNSVDLRFRDLVDPKIRLRIAGIVIGQGRAATPYINNLMKDGKYDFRQAINDMQTYWKIMATHPDLNPDAYHIIITMTDAKMYDPQSPSNDNVGAAFRANLCPYSWSRRYPTVGLVTDNTAFRGILVATHELGHIFGADHDSDRPTNCAESLGYIMSPIVSKTLQMNKWSPCSKLAFQVDLFDKHCADKPTEVHDPGYPIPRIAPGDMISSQLQCEAERFSWACDPEPKTCEKLQCWLGGIYGIRSRWQCQNATIGALDGTPCAPNAVCVSGECRKGDQIIH